ncbi:hypothetical protein BAUCODRAFT_120901 [Baudoinia panamericana UAMH 10762]|uniref:SnoaL-like domain-containing protein n=1 Tax=Baudoinia panamericana (strain UAMH 10762) TaxID=717646 RepID=M2NG77_BAUPA|nr:uncharacterized protein BAUCODRAFT_120901 [Baudoinia panamericana UAMH 10762]EMC97985.1 hypothetical protein BAUCODRAFT_120901 [Baudoinia panamericana UAMH 10762]
MDAAEVTSQDPKSSAFLEHLSRAIIEECGNAKNFDSPIMSLMAPTFSAVHDSLTTFENRADFLVGMKAHFHMFPRAHLEVLNTSSDVDDEAGRADVFLFFRISGVGRGLDLKRECVALMQWERRENGQWMAVRYKGMRGSASFRDI